MEFGILEILVIVIAIIEFTLLYILRQNRRALTPFVKSLVFFSILVIPIFTFFLGNYHVFVSSKEVESCMNCHVMKPFGNDMMYNPQSMTLAARHYRNNWIKENECYSCHKDYGFQGTLKAKADGYRHLMKYITGTYQEPITFRGEFNSMNCMGCHENTPAFEELPEHQPIIEDLASDNPTLSCLNCHGTAHPQRSRRTPGHPDYEKLKGDYSEDNKMIFTSSVKKEDVQKLAAFIESIPTK